MAMVAKMTVKSRQNELAALLIEMVEDVARRSRCIDDTRDAVVDDDRHRREHVDADAAADRVDRRRRLVGFANPQGRPVLSLQRRGYFLDMGERLADLVASGDHDAAGIENAETGERDFLRFPDDRHQPRTDLDIGSCEAGALAGKRIRAAAEADRRRRRDRAQAGSASTGLRDRIAPRMEFRRREQSRHRGGFPLPAHRPRRAPGFERSVRPGSGE